MVKMRVKVSNYKRFRELVNEWVDLSMELERIERHGWRPHNFKSEVLRRPVG